MGKGKLKLHCLAGQDSFKEKASVLALLSAAFVADAVQCHTSESLQLVYSVKTSLSDREKKAPLRFLTVVKEPKTEPAISACFCLSLEGRLLF